jgi:predicted RNA polymerase sigma factor
MSSLADQALQTFRAEHAPVFAALWRRFGEFDLVDAALADAYQAAMAAWPAAGVPQNPASWMATVAMSATTNVMSRRTAGAPSPGPSTPVDDLQALILGCCHPDLSLEQGVVCMGRAVAGLMPFELSELLAVPEAIVTGRLDGAKTIMRRGGFRADVGDDDQRGARVARAHQIVALVRALPSAESATVAGLIEQRVATAFTTPAAP